MSAAHILVVDDEADIRGLLKEIQSGIRMISLVCDHAQKIEGVGIAWLGGQDVEGELLRFGKPARLPEPHGLSRQFRRISAAALTFGLVQDGG